MKDLALGITVYDDAVQDCESIIEWLDQQKWDKSTVYSGISDHRTSDSVFVPLLAFRNPQFIHEMNKTVWLLMDEYATRWDISFSNIESVSVQRYEIGQFYKEHADAGPDHPRIISAVAYLNDVEEGGETEFPYFDIKVQPRRGRVVIFPSNFIYTHAALAPVSNPKYAAAYWALS